MKKIIGMIFSLIFLFSISSVSAKTIDTTLIKTYGGTSEDCFKSVVETEDGGYVAVGYTASSISELIHYASKDAIIVRYNKDGSIKWQKSYGGNSEDFFYGVTNTKDGGFAVTGYTYSSIIEGNDSINELTNKGISNGITVKFDKDGNVVWQNIFGGNMVDLFNAVTETSDGDIVVVGNLMSSKIIDTEKGINIVKKGGNFDGVIVSYDADGEYKWSNSCGGSGDDTFGNVQKTSDGSVLVSMNTKSSNISGFTSHGGEDIGILKYDKNGVQKMLKSYGGSATDSAYGICVNPDDTFVVVGKTSSSNLSGITNKGRDDGLIVKYSADGENVLWQKIYGGIADDYFNGITITKDGGYALAGATNSNNIPGITLRGEADVIAVIIDKDGNVLWENSYGGAKTEYFYSICTTTNDEYVIVGQENSIDIPDVINHGGVDALLVKVSPTYLVNSSSSELIFNKTSKVTFNEKVTITVPSKKGYKVKRITGVNATLVNANTYTFYMPLGDVEVGVEYEKIPEKVKEEKDEKDDTPKTGINYLIWWICNI